MERLRGVKTRITPDRHAVVVGGGIGGMLAARVLSEYFTHVTVLERDDLPRRPAHRPGVPQDRHPHLLLAQGYRVLEELLPGIGTELIATFPPERVMAALAPITEAPPMQPPEPTDASKRKRSLFRLRG